MEAEEQESDVQGIKAMVTGNAIAAETCLVDQRVTEVEINLCHRNMKEGKL